MKKALLAVGLGVGVVAIACSGSDGTNGTAGPQGPAGSVGQTGAQGTQGLPGEVADAGNPLAQGACTTPCHTFGGVVDQWRFSNHSHPQENEIGVGPCGNCHGIDGIQQRLSNNYVVTADAGTPPDVSHGHVNFTTASGSVAEISYGGATTVGQIHCTTCHDFNPTNDPHVTGKYNPGQAPLRVPGGIDDYALLEKTPASTSPLTSVGQPVKYLAANTCIFCHKSRKDVTLYIGANNPLNSVRWGPHEGPQADVYSGLGGYAFSGQTYSSSRHATLTNACIDCHMSPNPGNGNVPDHSMKPSLTFCKTCHTEYTGQTFDVQGGQSIVKNALFELQGLLNTAGMLTRASTSPYDALGADELADAQFNLDSVRPNSGLGGASIVANSPTAGALYNYLLIARSKDFGVHNPTYAKQLLWDSIKQIKGANPTSLAARPQ
jgi:hypothetical protein